MILCTNNLLEDATITITDGSSDYPSANLFSNTLHGYEGKTLYTTEILIDLGSAKKVTAIGIINSSALLTVSAGSNGITYGYTISPTKIVTEINQTYRYWKISTTALGYQYIGKFYLGEPIKSTYHKPGVTPSYISNDIKNKSISGRTFSQPGIIRKTEAFVVSVATEQEYLEWIDLYENRLTRLKPVIFCQFEETQTAPFEPYFAELTFVPKGRDLSQYSFTFGVEEVT